MGIKEHLEEAEKTYWAHLKHAFRQSNKLIVAAIKSYIHGVFPSVYISDAPLTVIKIYREIRRIRHIQKLDKALK
jgi:hypothetical protein